MFGFRKTQSFYLTFDAELYDERAWEHALDAYESGASGEEPPDWEAFSIHLDETQLQCLSGAKLKDQGYEILRDTYENFDKRSSPPRPVMQHPVLRFQGTRLYLEIGFSMKSKISPLHIADAAAACKVQLGSDKWPLSCFFAWPKEFAHCRIEIASSTQESPDLAPASLEAIVEVWSLGPNREFAIMMVHEKLDGLALEEVISVYKTLRALAIRSVYEGGESEFGWQLWTAVSSQLMRRFQVGSNERIDARLLEESNH